MNPAEKLLLITGIGRSVCTHWRVRRVASAMLMLMVLAIILAALISGVMFTVFYTFYIFLLSQAVMPIAALLGTAGAAILVVLALAASIRSQLHMLAPSGRHSIGDIADAFLDGLLSGR